MLLLDDVFLSRPGVTLSTPSEHVFATTLSFTCGAHAVPCFLIDEGQRCNEELHDAT